MSLRLGYRPESYAFHYPDKTTRLILDGEAVTLKDYTTGVKRQLEIRCRETDGAGEVFVVDPTQALLREIDRRQGVDRDIVTEDDRIAVILPGCVWGMQITAESYEAGHVIIEAIDFGTIGEVKR